MQSQLKKMSAWGRRKAILFITLAFSILLLGISVNHFSRRNLSLELEVKKSSSVIQQKTNYSNRTAYAGVGAAFFLIVCVYVLLLKEIRLRRKIVEELKLQKEHYQITINSIGEGLITTGKNGEILFMNTAAEKLTGWSNKEAKNLPLQHVYDVVNEESGQPFEHIVGRIMRKGELVEFENNTLLNTKEKNQLIISNSGSPLFDSKGNITGTVLVFNDITEKKKIETESIEEEKRIAKAIMDAQEQERRHIGQELHDNVNQILACSLLTAELVSEYISGESKAIEFNDLTKKHTLEAIREIRKLSHELTPVTFEDITLKSCFEALLSEINLNDQFAINFSFDDPLNSLISDDIKINLYRILQEQLKNILKYSDAKCIDISLSYSDHVLTMKTIDNGKGFDVRNAKKGIGLNNMKKRAELFGGKMMIRSKPDKGCAIIVEIPFRRG